MIARRWMLALVGSLVVPVLFAGTWKVDGKAVPDNSWAKSDGDFAAQLVLTDKPDEFLAAWQKPGPAVLISNTGKAVRGKPIVGVVLFSGCARNDRGNCDATVQFTISGPDGKAYGEPQGGELWTDKPPPTGNQVQLSVGNIAVVIEPGDALGTYTAVAAVHDRVSKKTMVLKKTFEAVEAGDKK